MNLHAIEQMQLWGRRRVDLISRRSFAQSQQSHLLSPPVAANLNSSRYDS